ncbi:MAG: hypothetical protein IKW68_00855 [Clostridia bacterium]|nr:hypothetical protein [Clostridia bacterium]
MARTKNVDWNAIKTEYITTGISHRGLSEKYGVAAATISVKSSAEGWVDLKKQFSSETLAKAIENESDKQADRINRILRVSDKLLTAVEKAVDAFLSEELMLDRGALKQLTGAVKDIKDIQLVKDDSNEVQGITVVFGDGTEEMSG